VGTAIFANPRAPWIVQRELEKWMRRHHVLSVSDLVGAAHA
jgi:dihydroorotate dehydrogenase